MTKTKRLVASLMIFVMALTMCACSTSTAEEAEVEIEEEEDTFADDYTEIVNEVEDLNTYTSAIVESMYSIWDAVGADAFLTCIRTILTIDETTTVDNIDSSIMKLAAYAIFPDEYPGGKGISLSDTEEVQEVIDVASAFSSVFYSLDDLDDELTADLKEFKAKYTESHPDEVENLSDWCLESSLYVDFAQNPSGSLVEYRSSMTDYQDSMRRFQKIAETY
jgi:hypothetical protein